MQKAELEADEKFEVEDITGCIPLFLNNCIVGGEIDLTTEFFRQINNQVAIFEWEIQKTCLVEADLRKYGILILPTQLR